MVLIIIRDVQNALPFFLLPAGKNAHVYKPPAGLTDKQRLSSELDKILSRDISGILKIKRGDALCSA